MTTGNFSQGNYSEYGPFSRKAWSGEDNVPFVPAGTKFKNLPPIGDPWGNLLTPADGLEYRFALIRAKGIYLAQQRGVIPNAGNAYYGLHNYDKTHVKGQNSPVQSEYYGWKMPYASAFGIYAFTDPWSSNDDLKLIDKLRERIQGSDLHAGVALVEVDRAMKMLRDDLTNLAWATASFRRGDVRAGVNWLFAGDRARRARETGLRDHVARNSSDRYLVWTYGYEPLLRDADAALRYTAWKLNGTPRARVDASRRIPMTNIRPSFPPAGSDPSFTFGYSSARCVAYLEDVDQVQLLGLYDVPSMLYERTPWSFVADWVVPIGAYLSALNTVRSLSGKFVVTRKVYSQWRPALDRVESGSWISGCRDTWWSNFRITRAVYSNLDVPFPSVKPAARIASAGHALNAVALLTQQLGKKFTFL